MNKEINLLATQQLKTIHFACILAISEPNLPEDSHLAIHFCGLQRQSERNHDQEERSAVFAVHFSERTEQGELFLMDLIEMRKLYLAE